MKREAHADHPEWDEWYDQTRDEIMANLGKLEVLSRDKNATIHLSWIRKAYEIDRAVIEVLNQQWKTLKELDDALSKLIEKETQLADTLRARLTHFEERLGKRLGAAEQRFDARENEITEILQLLLQWKKDYQPTLDEAKGYFEDKAGRIGKP